MSTNLLERGPITPLASVVTQNGVIVIVLQSLQARSNIAKGLKPTDIRLLSMGFISARASPLFTPSAPPEEDNSTLVIVLSVVFGFFALLMVVSATIFIIRWRRNSKYHRRGITPVNDEEIERWRGRKEIHTEASSLTQKSHRRQASSIVVMSHPPGWAWSAEPSPFGSKTSGETALSPPPMVARAPNSRTGLTDGAIPGADPFIAPVRRPSTKLAKHGRNQSRKSSLSASIAERLSMEHSRYYREDSKKSLDDSRISPPSSIFNGTQGYSSNPLPTLPSLYTGTISKHPGSAN